MRTVVIAVLAALLCSTQALAFSKCNGSCNGDIEGGCGCRASHHHHSTESQSHYDCHCKSGGCAARDWHRLTTEHKEDREEIGVMREKRRTMIDNIKHDCRRSCQRQGLEGTTCRGVNSLELDDDAKCGSCNRCGGVARRSTCNTCGGSGSNKSSASRSTCSTCGGGHSTGSKCSGSKSSCSKCGRVKTKTNCDCSDPHDYEADCRCQTCHDREHSGTHFGRDAGW